jgi:hypothetical protein
MPMPLWPPCIWKRRPPCPAPHRRPPPVRRSNRRPNAPPRRSRRRRPAGPDTCRMKVWWDRSPAAGRADEIQCCMIRTRIKRLNYLYTTATGPRPEPLRQHADHRHRRRGLDPRWPRHPLIAIQSIQVIDTNAVPHVISAAPDNVVIDGRAIAAQIQRELAQRVAALKTRVAFPASRLCAWARTRRPRSMSGARKRPAPNSAFFPKRTSCRKNRREAELLALLEKLNADPRLHGILVQAPLPKQIRESVVYSTVLPQKDVDGFHPVNVGKLMLGDATGFHPARRRAFANCSRARSENRRRGSGDSGPRQHRRQTDGRDALPEGQKRERDGDDLPFRPPATSRRTAAARTF